MSSSFHSSLLPTIQCLHPTLLAGLSFSVSPLSLLPLFSLSSCSHIQFRLMLFVTILSSCRYVMCRASSAILGWYWLSSRWSDSNHCMFISCNANIQLASCCNYYLSSMSLELSREEFKSVRFVWRVTRSDDNNGQPYQT